MKKKMTLLFLLPAVMISSIAEAQVIMRTRMDGRYDQRPKERISQHLPKYESTVNISAGYGFPNTDNSYLPEFYNVYKGNSTYTGPFTGSLDYQFSRRMSIGILVTHGTITAPYYDYNSPSALVFNAKLESWSFMLNITRYIPMHKKATPYIRTAIGLNSWKQGYTDNHGNPVAIAPVDLPDLAYQAGIGVKFSLSKKAGVFMEAGYGKYILQGGLALKF